MRLSPLLSLLLVLTPFANGSECHSLPNSDGRREALDRQYATIETATFKKDPALLFSVYAPDFEAHQFNGQVWKFNQSAAYSTAGMDQVKENISLSNTIISLNECDAKTLVATVLQQWSRRQMSRGKERLFQTTTVQDETWVNSNGTWLRKRVDNERPGAWLIDLKRVDPFKPFDSDAPEYDPHQTKVALTSLATAEHATSGGGEAVSATDRAEITQTALDYIEGWYEGNAQRMERSLHPELAKRMIETGRDGKSKLNQMSAMTLVQYTRNGGGRGTPAERQQKDVTILDVFGNAASVKIVASDWVDYLHIAKFNGRWVIVNVLWELKQEKH